MILVFEREFFEQEVTEETENPKSDLIVQSYYRIFLLRYLC
jgi:hypothetical protein